MKIAKYTDEDGEAHVGHPYFLDLISDREKQPFEPAPTEPEKARQSKPKPN